MRAIFEVMGVAMFLLNALVSSNPMNVVRATAKGLTIWFHQIMLLKSVVKP